MNEIPQTSKNMKNGETGGPNHDLVGSTEEELGHDHRRRNCDLMPMTRKSQNPFTGDRGFRVMPKFDRFTCPMGCINTGIVR